MTQVEPVEIWERKVSNWRRCRPTYGQGATHPGDDDAAPAGQRINVSVSDPSTQALVLYGRSLIGARRSSLAIWSLQRAVEREDAPPRAPR